jgi:hypothetical protein
MGGVHRLWLVIVVVFIIIIVLSYVGYNYNVSFSPSEGLEIEPCGDLQFSPGEKGFGWLTGWPAGCQGPRKCTKLDESCSQVRCCKGLRCDIFFGDQDSPVCKVKLNGRCSIDEDCFDDRSCIDGKCKSNSGASCGVDSDCAGYIEDCEGGNCIECCYVGEVENECIARDSAIDCDV